MIKDKLPFFSIVIPTYNHGHLIHRCLESVLAQTYKNWEAIIINNFSSDKTVDVVSSYKDPRIRLINFANEGVIAASRNKGILEAKGEWICFLDSDDWWVNEKLAECIPFLNDFDLIYHDLRIFNSSSGMSFRKVSGRKLNRDCWRDLIVDGNAIPNSSVIVRSEIIRKVGLFSEKVEMFAIEDSDCWIRIASINAKFRYIKKALGFYWIGGNTSISVKQLDREAVLLEKYLEKLLPKDQKLACKGLYYRQARICHKQGLFRQARKKYLLSIHAHNKRTFFALLLIIASLLNIKY